MSKPTFIAYSVTDYTAGTEKKSKWREVGAAFAHKDGEGFDIVLEAFPVSGKVTLRKPKEKDEGHADVRFTKGPFRNVAAVHYDCLCPVPGLPETTVALILLPSSPKPSWVSHNV